MNDTLASFNPALLVLARERAQMTQKALAEKAGVKQASISKYESGKAVPSPEILQILAETLEVLPSFFEQAYNEVASGLPHHRKFSSLPAKVRQYVEAEARARLLDIIALQKLSGDVQHGGYEVVSRLMRLRKMTPEEVARWLRVRWVKAKLLAGAEAPIDTLGACVESLGIPVLAFDFGTSLLDGFFLHDQGLGVIAINDSADFPIDRQRFTLAHELGHALLHREAFPQAETEDEANRFAAELLLPEHSAKEDLRDAKTLFDYKALKAKWGISIAALGRRARDVEIYSNTQYRNFCIGLNMMGMRKREPACSLRKVSPMALRKLLSEALQTKTREALATVLGISMQLFEGRYGALLKEGV